MITCNRRPIPGSLTHSPSRVTFFVDYGTKHVMEHRTHVPRYSAATIRPPLHFPMIPPTWGKQKTRRWLSLAPVPLKKQKRCREYRNCPTPHHKTARLETSTFRARDESPGFSHSPMHQSAPENTSHGASRPGVAFTRIAPHPPRVSYSEVEYEILKFWFKRCPYLSPKAKQVLSDILNRRRKYATTMSTVGTGQNVSVKNIQTWFQNTRAKNK